jgi:hypothetical protein
VQLSKHTANLLASLDALSGRRLLRRDDLGALIELASLHGRRETLNELSFQAKFISKSHGIMQRIGAQGEGYERLSEEFTNAIKTSMSLIDSILTDVPPEERQRFAATYQALTSESLYNLLALFSDLSWYKNWMIDHP